jgi:5-methylcytosine-specific restriction enzyme A
VEPVIRRLSVAARSRYLGQSFQGLAAVRVLKTADHQVLSMFASGLRVLERVAFYPEDAFEARLIHGDAARQMVISEAGVAHNRRMRYLYESLNPTRARRHAIWLQERYAGKCQICLYDPVERYGHQICHAHHIQWLSRGGEDNLKNLVLVCPNHHAAIHQVDAPFDFADLTFEFKKAKTHRREPLLLNSHLRAAL